MTRVELRMTWIAGDHERRIAVPLFESYEDETISLMPSVVEDHAGKLFSLRLIPRRPLMLRHLSLALEPEGSPPVSMMLNGYQSWTQSREAAADYTMSELRSFMIPLLGSYGEFTREIFPAPEVTCTPGPTPTSEKPTAACTFSARSTRVSRSRYSITTSVRTVS